MIEESPPVRSSYRTPCNADVADAFSSVESAHAALADTYIQVDAENLADLTFLDDSGRVVGKQFTVDVEVLDREDPRKSRLVPARV